jgi:glutathione S-transferase
MYRLYGFPTQNTKKVLYVLHELKVPFEYQAVDLRKGEQKTVEFTKKNPIGKVPVLQHDDNTLFESGAICRYVANVANSDLYPADKWKRAKVDQWMDFFTSHLGRWFSTLFYETIIKPIAQMGEPDAKSCEEAKKFIKEQGEKVDQWLASNHYLIGEEFTIADLFAYAYVEQSIVTKVSLDPFPNLKRWFEEIGKRDSIKKGQAQLEPNKS